MLETLVQRYVENNAVLAFCRSCKYDINGNKYIYTLQSDLSCEIVCSGKDFISKYMFNHNSVSNASSAIFSREVAMSIDKRYMTMRGEGDRLFWIELMEHGNVCIVTKELNYFRFHDSNTTRKLAIKGIGQQEHKVVFDYLVKNGYIPSNQVRQEKLETISRLYGVKYESWAVKRKVFNTWDKTRFYRLYLALSNLKSGLLIVLRDL